MGMGLSLISNRTAVRLVNLYPSNQKSNINSKLRPQAVSNKIKNAVVIESKTKQQVNMHL